MPTWPDHTPVQVAMVREGEREREGSDAGTRHCCPWTQHVLEMSGRKMRLLTLSLSSPKLPKSKRSSW